MQTGETQDSYVSVKGTSVVKYSKAGVSNILSAGQIQPKEPFELARGSWTDPHVSYGVCIGHGSAVCSAWAGPSTAHTVCSIGSWHGTWAACGAHASLFCMLALGPI